MRFIPGDSNKKSLAARGLDFEKIMEAIERGIVHQYPSSTRPGQIVVIIDIEGYMHCAPCEQVGRDTWRVITAWPSRKNQKRYQK